MSKKNIDKQVYEQYVDATVALFMEHYGMALTDATMQTKTSEPSCSEALDMRCMTAIRKECAKLRRKELWKSTKRVLRSAAVLVVALLSLSSVLFMTVEAFRLPIINFYIEQGDGYWAITGKSGDDLGSAASGEFNPQDPLAGLLTEGYQLEKVSGDLERGIRAAYINSQGDRIRFVITRAPVITVDSENAPISKEYLIAGCAGVYVHKDGLFQLGWVNKETNMSYLLSSDSLTEEELLSVAEQFMEKFGK